MWLPELRQHYVRRCQQDKRARGDHHHTRDAHSLAAMFVSAKRELRRDQ